MSYCRFSTDDFQCDIYCYASDSGWVIHVAGNRCVFKEELPPVIGLDDMDAWFTRHQHVMRMVGKADRVPIGLFHDGETYNELSPLDAANRLISLKTEGYNVPQDAIDALLEEAND